MDDELEVLFEEEAVHDRVRELGERISRDFAGRELVVICVLKAAAVFTADLVRSLSVPATVEFVTAASYGSATTPRQEVVVTGDGGVDLAGKHVLLVDTIADSGATLGALRKRYLERRPASLRTAVLLDKRGRRTVDVPLDYVGFEAPDRFVVGYGMDSGEKYRNLPYIAALKNSDE